MDYQPTALLLAHGEQGEFLFRPTLPELLASRMPTPDYEHHCMSSLIKTG